MDAVEGKDDEEGGVPVNEDSVHVSVFSRYHCKDTYIHTHTYI